jgi:hypothetical protein
MARMPGAEWRPISVNRTPGGQDSVRGVVVHIMAGTFEGTDSWFRNPKAQASSHFGTSKTGRLRQWVDTADRAWAQAGGNRQWLSVENEGKGGDKLTDAQLDANARVLAWAHTAYDVPLRVAHSPSERGLGYHAMGGSDWGGHTSCPGSRIVAQLDDIVRRAKAITEGTAPGKDEPAEQDGPARYRVTINGLEYGYGATGAHVTAVGKALVAKGHGDAYQEGPGPTWSDADTENYAAFQRSLGYKGADADGVPGESSLRALLGSLPSKPKGKPAAKPKPAAPKFPGRDKFQPGAVNEHVTRLGRQLVAKGYGRHYRTGPGPRWTEADRLNVAAFQRAQGWTGGDADGYPGPETWRRLFA